MWNNYLPLICISLLKKEMRDINIIQNNNNNNCINTLKLGVFSSLLQKCHGKSIMSQNAYVSPSNVSDCNLPFFFLI